MLCEFRSMQSQQIDETLIAAIYGPALHKGDWGPSLNRLRLLLDSSDVALSVFRGPTQMQAAHATGRVLSPQARDDYARFYGRIDPKLPILARRGEGYVFNDIDHFSEGFISRNRFYQEYSRPIDSRHTLDMLMRRERGQEFYLAAMRSRRQGPFEACAVRVLRQSSRHFVRAWKLKSELETASHSGLVLERLRFGIIVLDGASRVVLVNRAARPAIAPGEELRLRDGRLTARSAAIGDRLQAMIAKAQAGAGGASVLRIPRASGRYWVLWSGSLPAESPLAGAGEPGVLIVLRDPDQPQQLEQRDLMALHDLTQAEARLALALGRGETLQTFAAARGVASSTVHTQLISIMRKMGIHRQAGLTRVLASISAMTSRNDPG